MEQPLAGRTVVITRAASQADDFANALENYGAKVVICPTIEITEPESYARIDDALDHVYGYDWVIFTSANAVKYFLRRLAFHKREVSDLDQLQVCAIGDKTSSKLVESNVHVDLVPSSSRGEGVFAALSDFVGGSEQLRGLNFLLPRAAVARDYLPQALEAVGARVDVAPIYRTVIPEGVDRGRLAAVLAGSADCIAFTSSSTVRNLGVLFDTCDLSVVLKGLTIACIGDVTTATATGYGLRVDIQPTDFSTSELAKAIADYYSTNN
ncbi:MAG: uroporphyrinogen-III synthase [Pyrinomonadaceae bacterium]